MNEPILLVVDLFCGAGGTSTGFAQAEIAGFKISKVIACVNHDPIAIKSHWANHKEVKHFEEDIRTLDLRKLVQLVKAERRRYPNAKLVLWASLECTNFSKAKGGLPRDADSRTLADHLDRYVKSLNPDYIQIENVVEFMSWGPLDKNGKPISRKNGQDWIQWRNRIKSYGYNDEWRELNSANFGAYTSRNRLFGIFAKYGLPIQFPEGTHAQKPTSQALHGDLKKWKAVKEVLDFEDEGTSIFNRKIPLVDNTLDRVYAGLVKFVAKGDKSFLSKYYSGLPSNKNKSVEEPAGSLTTIDHHALVQSEFLMQSNGGLPSAKVYPVDAPGRVITTSDNQSLVQAEFLVKYNSKGKDGHYNPPSIEEPSPVISTQNRLYLAQPQFLSAYYGSGDNVSSIENPAPTLRTKDTVALVHPEYFLDKQYTGYRNNQSIDQPAGSIMPNDKHALVEAQPFIMPTNYNNKPTSIEQPSPVITANRKHHYLVNPSWYGNPGSIEKPCCVIVARQDKAPLYFVQVEHGNVTVPIYEGDSEIMIKIKQFMAAFNIVDIKMRMLRVKELLRIQGFPDHYILKGNQSDQKKFIGNSVVPHVVKAWAEALAQRLIFDSMNTLERKRV